ncbi:MAG: hypothetical protein K8S27_13430 [Candidatus Omnitrophica bacterium]|nr:hypothetical protein [Candidatus Omnitrophota bacterium]
MSTRRSFILYLFKGINSLLFLSFVSLLIYVGMLWFQTQNNGLDQGHVLFSSASSSKEQVAAGQPQDALASDFFYYQTSIESNDIFTVNWEEDDRVKKAVPAGDVAVQELKQAVRILGILIDDHPIVIVESIRSRETLFMKVGDTVESAQLKGIYPEKVVFEHKGEEVIFEQNSFIKVKKRGE